MFNSYASNQDIKINAVSGTLVKNFRKSFFVDTSTSSNIFSDDPKFQNSQFYTCHEEPVVVLQTMLIGNGRCISEVMWKKDFDELFPEDKNG